MRLRLFSVLGGVPYYQLDDDGNITETLTATGGEFVKTYVHSEPRLSMKLQLGAKHSLKLGYSRTTQDIRAISSTTQSMPIDRYTMTSNILLPEIADQVALGWTGMTTDGIYDFSAETYYKHINNTYDYRDGKSFYSEIEIERLVPARTRDGSRVGCHIRCRGRRIKFRASTAASGTQPPTTGGTT